MKPHRRLARPSSPVLLLVLLLLRAATAQDTAPASRPAGTADPGLTAALEREVAGFRGDVGIYVRHLGSGRTAAIRADELFPTASLIKVPILLALFQRVADGTLDYHGKLAYAESRKYPGEDLLASFRDGEPITVSKLVTLMETFSDNTASLWCQELAGGGSAINDWLDRHGFRSTRVNSRTPGREKDREAMGWGQTTPREMAELVVMIREGRAVNAAASEEMYRTLCRTYWDSEALAALPPTVHAATKQGAVNASRSEVLLVNAPSGDFVVAVITRNQVDRSWTPKNEGFVLLRRVAALLWRTFEPGHPYVPPDGIERFW